MLFKIVGFTICNNHFCFSLCSKFDTLIQAQARELSHLRQRLREGRGVCNILTQHLGDTTKAFEELLRANDIDYYMGQSFRDQLAQSSALAQRVSAKISGREWSDVITVNTHQNIQPRHEVSSVTEYKDKLYKNLSKLVTSVVSFPTGDHSEDPDEKTELLAIRSVLITSLCALCVYTCLCLPVHVCCVSV